MRLNWSVVDAILTISIRRSMMKTDKTIDLLIAYRRKPDGRLIRAHRV
jgi:hypothetical protein